MAVTAANNLSLKNSRKPFLSVPQPRTLPIKNYRWMVPLLIIGSCLSGTYLKFMVRILSGTVIQYYPSGAVDYTSGPMEGLSD